MSVTPLDRESLFKTIKFFTGEFDLSGGHEFDLDLNMRSDDIEDLIEMIEPEYNVDLSDRDVLTALVTARTVDNFIRLVHKAYANQRVRQ